MAIETAKTGGRKRFVYWSVMPDPWVAFGEGDREFRKFLGKSWIEKVCIPGSAAVVETTIIGALVLRNFKALVGPSPLNIIEARGASFPIQERSVRMPNSPSVDL